ncbi:MAG: hypothetical protein PHC61_15005 [Chitinivibrionales bacterium]|nr:hypothetical protein [Chitinivibrionales bacterium]
MKSLHSGYLFALGLAFCIAAPRAQYNAYSAWLGDLAGGSGGHTVCQFLTLPVSAAGLSLADGASMDASSVVQFPANTGFFTRHKFMVSHLEWLMDLRKEFVAAAIPVADFGTAGFFAQVFTPGKFLYARDIDENVSNPSLLEYALGASYARALFGNHLSAGLSLQYIESRPEDQVGRALALNGGIAIVPLPWFNLNLFMHNLGTQINYGRGPELLPLNAGASMVFSVLKQPEDGNRQNYHCDIAVGCRKIADEPLRINAATEQALGTMARLRLGYELSYGIAPTEIGLNGGIGFTFKNYGFDLGWKNVSREFGAVWGVSTTMQLADLTPKTADDFYRIAERHFNNRRWNLCIEYAEKALELNPNLWKAHTLIARIDALRRRESGLEIALLYTGNTDGAFLPQPLASGEGRGGLARQAAVLRSLAAQFPLHCLIDAGNIITPATPEKKAAIAGFYYNAVNYDAIGLGENELVFGTSRFCGAAGLKK